MNQYTINLGGDCSSRESKNASFKMRVLICMLVLCQIVQGVRILGIFPHVGKSHFITFQPLLMELADRGHEVTVVSHFPLEKSQKNYRDISMAGSVPIWHSSFTFDDFTTSDLIVYMMTAYMFVDASSKTCEAMVKNPEVQNLKSGEFDVILVEQFQSDCGLGIVHKLGAPFIGVTSHYLMSYTRSRVGVIDNPAFVANHFLGSGTSPNLLQVMKSIVMDRFFLAMFRYIQMNERRMIKDNLIEDIPHLEDVAKNMNLLMTSTYYPLNGAQLLPPNVIEVGGFHLQKRQNENTVTEDLQKFIDESPQGVIIFSMGSMLRATSWPQEKLRAFQEAFSKLPQKVLWKWENDTMENIPGNVKIQKWIPQFSALRHPNVKGFIGHGGLGGMMEATHVGVPVLAIPMFGDQFCNSQSAKESGIAVVLDFYNISRESVTWGINELLTPRMQKRAKEVSAEWNDRPMSPMDTAIYWIEHVARHGGHLMRSPSVHVSWIRYYLLDVFAVFLLIDLVVLYIWYKLFRCCCRRVFGDKKSKVE